MEVKIDASEVTRLASLLEQTPQVIEAAKKEAIAAVAPKMKEIVDEEIGGTGKVRGWQGQYIGSKGLYSLGYYKAKGQFFTAPQPGDQIFFGDAKTTKHTGIVVKVAGGYVHTVEGNAGSPSAVRAKKYQLKHRTIKGYGWPDWGLVPKEKPAQPEKPAQTEKPAAPAAGSKKEDDDMTCYKTLADVPVWYKPSVQKAVDKGALNGTGNGEINVSEDFCRMLTVLDRLGKLD